MIYVYLFCAIGLIALVALRFVRETREMGDQMFLDELKCRKDREDEWL